MSARHKLNQANFKWAMLAGLLFGWMFQSFGAFLMATFFFVAAAWYSGDIRADGDYHYPAPPSPQRPRPSDPQRGTGRSRRYRRSRR